MDIYKHLLILLPLLVAMAAEPAVFLPGQVWKDTEGKSIQAHGGCVLFHGGTYFWYGENKDGPTRKEGACGARVDVLGVSCYTSTDLLHWIPAGVVLAPVADPADHDLHPSRVVERPKVLYHAASGTFVMWVHVDGADYERARVGVAVADNPLGPFTYQGSFKPDGKDSRDMTLFQDDDGSAYLIFSSDGNQTLRIAALSDDYRRIQGASSALFPGRYMEAPAVAKHDGHYYLIASGCSGWQPNAARSAVADAITGPWRELGNPCIGPGAGTTFGAQSAFLLPLSGRSDALILIADRWNPADLADSRQVWLPVEFRRDGSMRIEWRDRWERSVFDGRRPDEPLFTGAPAEVGSAEVTLTITGNEPEGVIHYTVDGTVPGASSAVYRGPVAVPAGREIRAALRAPSGAWSPASSHVCYRRIAAPALPEIPLASLTPRSATVGWGTLRRNRSIDGNPLRVAGKEYAGGLGAHAESRLVYGLDPSWRRFVAVVGIDDETGGRGSIQAEVVVDGVPMARTPILRGNAERSWNIEVAIPAGARELVLLTGDAGDGYGHDHADWVDAGFLR